MDTVSTDALVLDGSGTRDTGLQRQAGGSDRLPTDQGGHVIGHRFNPPADELNLFAQNGNFNMGAYRSMEGLWANALRQGHTVEVQWKFQYPDASLRPDKITVKFWIDGEYFERNFTNAPGGKQ